MSLRSRYLDAEIDGLILSFNIYGGFFLDLNINSLYIALFLTLFVLFLI